MLHVVLPGQGAYQGCAAVWGADWGAWLQYTSHHASISTIRSRSLRAICRNVKYVSCYWRAEQGSEALSSFQVKLLMQSLVPWVPGNQERKYVGITRQLKIPCKAAWAVSQNSRVWLSKLHCGTDCFQQLSETGVARHFSHDPVNLKCLSCFCCIKFWLPFISLLTE